MMLNRARYALRITRSVKRTFTSATRLFNNDEVATPKYYRDDLTPTQKKAVEEREKFFKLFDEMLRNPEYTPEKQDLDNIQKNIKEGAKDALSDESSKWGRQSTPLYSRDDRNQRFYRSVAIENYEFGGKTGHIVRIGQEQYLRSLTTNNVVIIPNLTLAHAVVGEWELQQEFIRPNTLPLSDILVKVQDVVDKPNDTGSKLKKTIIGFFDAEFVCHREGMKQRDKVEKHWNPLVKWFEAKYGAPLKVFDGEYFAPDPTQYAARSAFVSRYTTKSNIDFSQKDDILHDLTVVLDKLKPHELATLHTLVETTESAIISLALFHGAIDYEEAIQATQWPLLEQTEQHGVVMGDHDVMIAEQRLKISALALFKQLYELKEKV